MATVDFRGFRCQAITSLVLRMVEEVELFTAALNFLQEATKEEVYDSTYLVCSICTQEHECSFHRWMCQAKHIIGPFVTNQQQFEEFMSTVFFPKTR